MIFVDVVELRGRNAGGHYRDLVPRFRQLLGPVFAEQTKKGKLAHLDPAVAFGALYMQLFNYFMIERLFGVRHHFGMPHAEVVRQLSRLFRLGVSPRGSRRRS